MNSIVDLHMHSTASDGSDTIPELLAKIQQLGITTFAVTDHDKIAGALEMDKIVPAGIRYIRGIELSCITEVAKCHILGYNYDSSDAKFLDFVEEAYAVRINKTHNRLRYMEEEFGFSFTDEEKEEQLQKPSKYQLKNLLENKLKQQHPDSEPVDIFATYFKHLPSGRVDATRAIQAIKNAGGIAVWAHPLGGTGEKRLTKEKFAAQLQTLKNVGIAGVECYYSEYTMEEVEMLRKAAAEQGLFISGGSDYHGTNKPHLHLGMLNKNDVIVAEGNLSVLNMLIQGKK